MILYRAIGPCSEMFTREFLVGVRRKALRRGVWYGSLDLVERGILSLTARVVDRVESMVLGVEIVKILGKLRDASKGRFTRWMEEYGHVRASCLAGLAVGWGYLAAQRWASDVGFVRYVTAMVASGAGDFVEKFVTGLTDEAVLT